MTVRNYGVILLHAFITLFSFQTAQAQQAASASGSTRDINYRYPLAVPMNLSGNYGELRSNHFHGGIDFRIGGVVGAPVYATESGYISRITVSPTGYGNALYITHPNGYMSVYGHMHCFHDKIEQYVLDKQYESEEFRQDLTLTPDLFPVQKGDLIGKAGNSGSSGGPHLHFEIRDTANLPLNIFARGMMKIGDKTPPVIRSVDFFSYTKDTGVVKSRYICSKTQTEGLVRLPQISYIAIDAIDMQEGTTAKLAVNEYKVYLDTTLVYALEIGEVPFEKGRYINSLMEYSRRQSAGKYMIKSYVEPGNVLKDRIRSRHDGLIVLADTLVHKVRVEVLDYLKNKTTKTYAVKRGDSPFEPMPADTLTGNYIAWYLPGFYNVEGLDLHIPQAALYNSIYLKVDTAAQRVTPFAPVWKLHEPEVALHTPATVSIACKVPDNLIPKVMLVQVGKGGRLSAAGGVYDTLSRAVKGKIAAFGDYTVAADLAAPKITPSIANNAVVKGNQVTFIIRDDLSGIKSYRVEIDGHWVLAGFDAKNSRLSVSLPHARIKKGGKHNLTITVTDYAGNASVLKRAFTW